MTDTIISITPQQLIDFAFYLSVFLGISLTVFIFSFVGLLNLCELILKKIFIIFKSLLKKLINKIRQSKADSVWR